MAQNSVDLVLADLSVGPTSNASPLVIGATGVPVAAGFSSTVFGTPNITTAVDVEVFASGFTSTAFGTGAVAMTPPGFTSTQFGAPRLTTITGAVGIYATQVGTPTGYIRHPALWVVPMTSFGLPVRRGFPYVVDVAALRPTARFGSPYGFRPIAPANRVRAALGFSRTKFGRPNIRPSKILTTRWDYPQTTFGAPDSTVWPENVQIPPNWFAVVSRFRPTSFGRPLAVDNYQYPARGFTREGNVGRPRST